jgi:hypothetical protein
MYLPDQLTVCENVTATLLPLPLQTWFHLPRAGLFGQPLLVTVAAHLLLGCQDLGFPCLGKGKIFSRDGEC